MKKNSKFPVVFNKPINPVSDPDFETRKTKPVTPDELGGYYLTTGMRSFRQIDGLIDIEELKKDLDRWHNFSLEPGESAPDLMHHNFGQALWLHISFLRAKNWKEAIEEIKKRGLYVYDCWDILPGCRDFEKGGYTITIPEETHNYLVKTLGGHFLGWDNGENDGRWFWQVMRVSPAPVNRKDAHRYFLGWFQPFFAELHNYVNSLCGLLFPHYFAKMEGQRLIGAEFLQALPSVTMWSAWVRGAARQYQMLWFSGISIWTNFGYKSFKADSFNYWTNLDSGLGFPGAQSGPDRGPSISLLRRTWYVTFMYGSNIQAMEDAQFYRPAGQMSCSISQADLDKESLVALEAKKEFLSPLGRMQLDAVRFCHRYEKRRGIQHCPVAAFLDFYAGWNPPRQLYTDSFYVVWGGIPYEAGDHQIDLFFREFFPDYQNCNFFRNEKGFLTPTPYGDIVDVLLSDCRQEILKRYQVVFALGEIKIENELFEKLREYVQRGGRVIWSLNQLGPEALKFCGIIPLGKKVKAKESRNKKTGRDCREIPFSLPLVESGGGEVLLETKGKIPIIIRKKIGVGEVITILPDFGLGSCLKENHPLIGADPEFDTHTYAFFDKPLGSPYRFLEGVKETIFAYLAQFNLIELTASLDPFAGTGEVSRPVFIQYLTNVTERPDRLVVTLVNNEPLITYVRLRIKTGKVVRAVDLLHGEKELSVDNGTVEVTLFPSDNADFNIYIIELEVDRPAVSFMGETK